MDGVVTVGEISRIRRVVRVVLSSGYGHQEAIGRFAGQGLSRFIRKPYTLDNLRGTLRLTVPDNGEQILKQQSVSIAKAT